MATPSEQKALAFVAMIVLLGGVVRVVRAGAPPNASLIEQQALARQASSADSAAAAPRSRKARAKGGRQRKAPAERTVIGGVASVPPGTPSPDGLSRDGFPPPSPRIDVDYRTNRPAGTSGVSPSRTSGRAVREPVDLDRATAQEIDVLPWVGPALAGRIVANRDSFGPFGSLEALGRVKGVGSGTRKRLAALVTFSGVPSSRR
jgi:DNA uptake protein ComE-like DNA-binding protein